MRPIPPAARRDAGQGARERRRGSGSVTGAGPPGQARAGQGAAQWQAVNKTRGPQDAVPGQLEPHPVADVNVELPVNERVNAARRRVAGKHARAATLATGATLATESRRNLDDGVRRFGAGINGENLAFGLLHCRRCRG